VCEAVDALLGVADDEDRHRLPAARAPAGAGITGQPAVQRMPLQRAGVLKLVDQQVADLRVQALLHPAGQFGIKQQGQRAALQIVHVDQAALQLQGIELGYQPQSKSDHAAVLQPGFMLDHRLGQARQVVGGGVQLGRIAEVLARRASRREQSLVDGVEGSRLI
jgi:hypothetical protein